MREVNIAGLDLNLVPALEALLRHRNVTKAAADAGMSQPAMSRALARLRALYGDPLLVRTRTGYSLTPRALAIQPPLALATSQLRHVFQTQEMKPEVEVRTVRLAAADTQTILFLPGLMARLAAEAPGVDLHVEAYRADTLDRLDNGTLDFIFALTSTPLPTGFYSELVAEDTLALVMRQRHPAAKRKWTIADYGSHEHVCIAMSGDGRSDIDALLAARGVKRRISLVTPHFMSALTTIAHTDLVSTMSASLARRFATGLRLILHKPPFADTRLDMTLVCSHVRASDPFLRWFRNLVREVARSVIKP
ncbi:MAG: LysR family transcriptional regulator [Micropepsaceae bacterium]